MVRPAANGRYRPPLGLETQRLGALMDYAALNTAQTANH
jgi:hypothetical protein